MAKLSEIILPVYHQLHRHIKNNDYSEYILSGGRGSGKSSDVSLELTQDQVRDHLKGLKSDTVIIRKIMKSHKKSTYNQILEAIHLLGLDDFFLAVSSPLEIRYYPNGKPKTANSKGREDYTNVFHFLGMDDPEKVKSFKPNQGHFVKNIWLEEPTEFDSIEEIEQSVYQSLLRGHNHHTNVFMTYNPPADDFNFMNQYRKLAENRADSYTMHTTYKDVPNHLLGESFLRIAERMQVESPKAYEHIYMGKVSGLSSRIFSNIFEVSYGDYWNVLANQSDKHVRGIDWGFTDPNAFVVSYWDDTNKDLYVLLEREERRQDLQSIHSMVTGIVGKSHVFCDNNNATVINELQMMGLDLEPVNKSLKDVVSQLEWMDLHINHIYIDGSVTPRLLDCITKYTRKIDTNTKRPLPQPKDNQDDHLIDALRYSLFNHIHGLA